jgi:hypothetical protein
MIDPNIIFQIRQPNMLAAMRDGTENAARIAGVQSLADNQNALRQYGPGAMRGEAPAMNALAAYDPQMVQGLQAGQLDMQSTRQGMAMDREKMQMLRDQTARELASAADQEAAMREAQDVDRVVQEAVRAFASGDERTWSNATASAFGQALPMSEEGVAVLGAFHDGAKAYLDARPKAPEEPADIRALRIRAQEAGLQPGTPEYAQFMAQGGRNNGFVFEQTGDGGLRMAQGDATTGFKFTEAQSKDNVFATRAEGALSLLDSVGAKALASRPDRAAEALDGVTMGLSRELQSEDFQVAQQSGNEFLQAILRKDTGAAITEGEQALYGDTYLPRSGDGPRVLEAKRQARIRAVEALKSGMNIQQLTVQQRALVQAADRAGVAPPAAAPVTDPLEGLSPEARAAFELYGAQP